jgi:hypothetical protein
MGLLRVGRGQEALDIIEYFLGGSMVDFEGKTLGLSCFHLRNRE